MPSRQTAIALLLSVLALAASGCARRTVRAAPPMVNPTPPAEPAATAASPPAEEKHETKPEAKLETQPDVKPEAKPEAKPETPPDRAFAPPKPAMPKLAPPKRAPLQISPRLMPEEQAGAERRTNEDIGIAERNLQVAYGRQLNAAQHDLVEKIRGFLAQARESIRASDWVRARNLAQKAHLLSVELVNSL
jgi:hypothetical protein